MGEKDFSDRALVGDDSLSYVSRDLFRAVRAGVSDPVTPARTARNRSRDTYDSESSPTSARSEKSFSPMV